MKPPKDPKRMEEIVRGNDEETPVTDGRAVENLANVRHRQHIFGAATETILQSTEDEFGGMP